MTIYFPWKQTQPFTTAKTNLENLEAEELEASNDRLRAQTMGDNEQVYVYIYIRIIRYILNIYI